MRHDLDYLSLTKALADETRLRLLTLLSQAHLTLAETERLLDQSGPRLSRHLKILVEAGIAERSKEGKEAYFRLTHRGEVRNLINPIISAMVSEDSFGDLERLQGQIRDQSAAAKDLEARFYAKWDQARAFFVDEQQAESRLVEIAKSLEKDGKKPTLLDIGTGTGRLLSALGPHVSAGLGIDTDRDMLSIARHRLAVEDLSHMSVRQGDMYDLALGGQKFDLICLYGVLKYAALPAPVLAEAAQSLSPSGTLLVVDFLEHQHEELSQTYGHKWLGFDLTDMKAWSESAGLDQHSYEEFAGARLSLGLWVCAP